MLKRSFFLRAQPGGGKTIESLRAKTSSVRPSASSTVTEEKTGREIKPYGYYTDKISGGVGRSLNLLMSRGEGSYLFDASGKKYLDYTCGIGVTNLGHCHPRLVKVAQTQAGQLWHGMVSLGVSTAAAEAIDGISSVLPQALNKLFLCTTGTEAVEAAIKVSRSATNRQMIVCLQGSYHGRTAGSAALTTSKYGYHYGFKPTMPGVVVAPCPYTSQMHVPIDTNMEQLNQQCLAILRDLIHQVAHPYEVAMIIAEPVLGEGAYLPLPAAYLKGLRAICDEFGILLCIDEVQSGYGRTGTMFNITQTEGVVPDMMTFAKGVANGLPLAGIAISEAVDAKVLPGILGGTYAGNAVSCASAAEVVKIMKEEGILDNVIARGRQLWKGVEDMMVRRSEFPLLEVRGRGLMIGVQFSDDAPTGVASEVMQQCCERGLMLLNTSKFEVLRFIPPLNTTEEEVKTALAIVEEAMEVALQKKGWDMTKKSTRKLHPCCEKPCFQLKGWGNACRHYVTSE